jgi:DNA-binding response OmpR family regulator
LPKVTDYSIRCKPVAGLICDCSDFLIFPLFCLQRFVASKRLSRLIVGSHRTVVEVQLAVDRILVIDDDVELCSLVSEYLEPEGFQVESAPDGTRGLEQALGGGHLLVVLDVMLPGLNGFEVLRRLRDKSKIPVLLLTARGEDVDRIVGLEIGADDYLPKPFNPRELVARIRAILRRTHTERTSSGQPAEILRVGDVELDPGTRTVLRKGKAVELTSVEFNLLHALLREAGRVVPRERLVDIVLSRKFSPFDRSIDMHVSKIRRKLGDSDSGVDHIKTVRGVGYIFTRPQEPAAENGRSSVP